jgi:2-methylcitrate dehydratase PrpD
MSGPAEKHTNVARHLAAVAQDLAADAGRPAIQALLRQCLIDAAAAAVAGYGSSAAKIATRFALRSLGSGNVNPWLSDAASTTPIGAAFINATAMSALDLDDGNRAARGHLGAAVVPAASAFGSFADVSPATFAHAVLAGCEIGARLGAAESPPHFASGRWAGVGAAVATGISLGFDETALASAISLAAHGAPLMAAAEHRAQMTGHIKEGVPFGLLSGVASALLAEQGYRGDPDAIESTRAYDVRQLGGQPAGPLAFRRTYFKRYSCCRLAHAPIDAALAIMARQFLAGADISRITIRTFRTAIELPNETRPASFESAQYSLPFCMAVALVEGPQALLPLRDASLGNPDVLALARRVLLEHDPSVEGRYPGTTPARVRIDTRGGDTYTEDRDTADGDPGRPFTDAQLLNKLQVLARGTISAPQLAGIVEAVQGGMPSAREFDTALRRHEVHPAPFSAAASLP